jgi:hypothetical protein
MDAPRGGTPFVKIVAGVACGGCLLVVGGVVIVALLVGRGVQVARQRAEQEREAARAMALSEITWEQIEEKFGPKSKLTGVQKDEEWKALKGKKVRWSGRVLAIHNVLGVDTMQVTVNPEAGLRQILLSDVFVALDAGEEARARALSRDAAVAFEAVLDRHSARLVDRWAMVTMVHGRIVE